MNPLRALHDAGQSLWLDNITRELLRKGTLRRYIDEFAITGLTSNPTIFDKAIRAGADYDESILEHLGSRADAERIFFELALEDLREAADLFRPVYDASDGRDGFVSLEVSPRLAGDARATVAEGIALHVRAGRPNLLIKVPGTHAGLEAIEELIFAGVPVNVTLLFSRGQYRAAAAAYLHGVERRVEAGLDPKVASFASIFVSRWDASTAFRLPPELRNQLGIAVAQRAYRAYRELLEAPGWQRLAAAGALPQRLLWASTGVKDESLAPGHYVTALVAPETVDTLPEATLLAFAERGELRGLLSMDTHEADRVVDAVRKTGIDLDALARELLQKGRDAFVGSWDELLQRIEAKATVLGNGR